MSEINERGQIETGLSRATLEKLADSAEKFLKFYNPPNHIWQAMKSEFAKDSPQFRSQVKREIEKILQERAKRVEKLVEPAVVQTPVQRPPAVKHLTFVTDAMIKGAAARMNRYDPPETHNSGAEEESRKPIESQS